MIICVDVGNSNIVFGVIDNEDKLLSSFRLEAKVLRTSDEYGIALIEHLRYLGIAPKDINGGIIASVVPQIDPILEKAFAKYLAINPLFVAPGTKTGIKIKIENPKQLGADLLVGAVAATNIYGAPCIIVDLGTATTLGVVNNNNEFLGGIIYPGVMTAYDSLIKSTALLESAKIGKPESVIGRDTMSSIQSGMIYGTIGAIDGIINQIKKEYGDMKVIVTGGISKFLMEHLNPEYIIDENLLMTGLNIIYKKNQ